MKKMTVAQWKAMVAKIPVSSRARSYGVEVLTPLEEGKRDDECWRIETWWDRYTRSWVTQLLTPEGYQVGEAFYSGCRENAASSHGTMINEAAERRAAYEQENQ